MLYWPSVANLQSQFMSFFEVLNEDIFIKRRVCTNAEIIIVIMENKTEFYLSI